MERKNFAALCAAVLCFWLFALALGTAEGVGLRAVMHPEERAVSADAGETAEGTALPAAAAAPQLSLNCRAAILIEQGSGRVLYEKNADERVPIASITKVMTLLLTFEAVHYSREVEHSEENFDRLCRQFSKKRTFCAKNLVMLLQDNSGRKE